MGEILKSGEKVGNYRIIESIGSGGMGRVYKAKQLSMNRIVALKVLSLRKEKVDPMLRRRFVNEARTAGKIAHENVIHVYDVGKTKDDMFFFSMEYIDGETVEKLLKEKGRFDVITALAITRGVLKGLIAASKLGIIHRDIKPDNIIIAKDGVTKLADLGLAKRTDLDKGGKITQEGVVMGTPHYMSPEQAQGEDLDVRTDIYSLGATLFHMVTGRTPYKGKSSYAIISSVIKGGAPVPTDIEPSIPPRVSDMIVRMMQHDPDDRFKSPESVMRELDAIETEASLLTDELPSGRGPVLDTRKKLLAALGGAVALLLLAVVTFALSKRSENKIPPDTKPIPIPVINGKEPIPPADSDPVETPVVPTAEYPFIYGDISEQDGVVRVRYDFAYSSQLKDWFPDHFWMKSLIKREVQSIGAMLSVPPDPEQIRLLESARVRYMREPEMWQIIDNALINRGQSDVEGFVNKLTFSGSVEILFTAEVKHTISPVIIVSFMNNQMGEGISLNLGTVSPSEKNLLVVSENGRRKMTEDIPIPFAVESGTPYTGMIRKKGEQVEFFFNKGETFIEAPPVYRTTLSEPDSGNLTLWSSREFIKFDRVEIAGNLLELNRMGWFSRSGNWISDGTPDGYIVLGRPDAPSLLEYGGHTAGKIVRATFEVPPDFTVRDEAGFLLEGTDKGRRLQLKFAVKGDSVLISRQQLSPGAAVPGMMRRDGGKRPQRSADGSTSEVTVKQGTLDRETDPETALSVVYEQDGISFLLNGRLFYRDIEDVGRLNRISITSNTRINLHSVAAEKSNQD